MPFMGDFVVLSLNPMLSVAHLDDLARKEASELRVGRYIAFVSSVQGLPLIEKPTNQFSFKLVRDQSRHSGVSAAPADLAIPIAPHTMPNQQDQLRAVADFPHPTCVLDTVLGDIDLRVASIERDCTQVLATPSSERMRVRWSQEDLMESLYADDTRWSEIEQCLPPRTSLKILWHEFPIRPPATMERDCPGWEPSGESTDSDEISDLCQAFADFLTHPGHLNIPVVDVEYDLRTVDSVADPMEFLRERWALYEIVRRATERMRAAQGLGPIG
ncbi:unnamed protein product [Peniophora sp. CBMAI 1063]|nr:unnamed protein product [Peniophora sp. CBMAI 1063]